ncbi:UDP-N-acetylmuramate--L-alanine ligase [Candidatus Uhrbacteria bacterium]|nr:UDP-N-acetylmuramate--L-alanine ligase [Candidatus Uhrbacteria bacterium]
MQPLKNLKNIHVVGAGGIGLSAAAKLLVHRGKTVTGSDLAANEATAELGALGVKVAIGQGAGNLPPEAEAVIFSSAVPKDNPERVEARKRGLVELSYFDFLGQLSREYRTIAVSGTNGKSTTTALLGLMLAEAGMDPTVVVGSRLSSFEDGNLRLGKGDLLVAEACEYRANMLKMAPQTIVLTNIEEDHLDFYRDLDHIRETFQKYLDRLPQDGQAIVNADDPNVAGLRLPANTVTYGIEKPADYRAVDLTTKAGSQSFSLNRRGESLGTFVVRIPGRYNAMNALAALAAALESGASPDDLRRTLAGFTGVWRRFQRLGKFNGSEIVSDYGHTPTAVRETVRAAREFFPGQRVLLCFQPHHRNRTRSLFNDFVMSLTQPDELVLVEIFDVAGREEPGVRISSADLLGALLSRPCAVPSEAAGMFIFVPDLPAAESALRERIRPGDVVIVMGAGDIYKIAENLVRP